MPAGLYQPIADDNEREPRSCYLARLAIEARTSVGPHVETLKSSSARRVRIDLAQAEDCQRLSKKNPTERETDGAAQGRILDLCSLPPSPAAVVPTCRALETEKSCWGESIDGL